MGEPIPSILEQAAQFARSATALDSAGDYTRAIAEYHKAIDLLEGTLRAGNLPGHQREYCERVMDQYKHRVAELQSPTQGEELLPPPPATESSLSIVPSSSHDVVPGGKQKDPTLVDTAIEASKYTLSTINKEGGKIARQGYQAAKEFNEKHDITGKTVAGGKAVYNKAKEINDTHHVTEKVATVVKATATKAKELNEQYRVTERIGNALSTGLNKASAMAQEYLDSRQQDKDKKQDP